jgi:ABC-type transport system involved in cytochrome bd biosynthesis fused ATPase/permease subunit
MVFLPVPGNVDKLETISHSSESLASPSQAVYSSSALVHSSSPPQAQTAQLLSLTQSQPHQLEVQRYLHPSSSQVEFYLEKGPIQPEVWPTKEEFQLAKKRFQYDPETLHFAICGGSGSGKSSLINAFRGLKSNTPQAARTGIDEITMAITRYPDPPRRVTIQASCLV